MLARWLGENEVHTRREKWDMLTDEGKMVVLLIAKTEGMYAAQSNDTERPSDYLLEEVAAWERGQHEGSKT